MRAMCVVKAVNASEATEDCTGGKRSESPPPTKYQHDPYIQSVCVRQDRNDMRRIENHFLYGALKGMDG